MSANISRDGGRTTLPPEDFKLRASSIILSLQQTLIDVDSPLDLIPQSVKNVIRYELWKERVEPRTGEVVSFKRFDEFVRHHMPQGLQTDMPTLRKLCQDDTEALDLLDGVMKQPHGGNHGNQYVKVTDIANVDNIHVGKEERPAGTSPEAALRRLRKDRPDLHQQVIAGELSPHAAAVQAGFRKPTLSVPVDSPCSAVKALLRRFTREELQDALNGAGA